MTELPGNSGAPPEPPEREFELGTLIREQPMDINAFLTRNRIEVATWQKANISPDMLEAIGTDHKAQIEHLRDAAELFVRPIQRCPSVHSVRWRVKDVDHLLEKIIRKRAEGEEKYSEINQDNYFGVVTDLVGLRALHLFKEECFDIDRVLQNTWALAEKPIAYVRKGDPEDLTKKFSDAGFEVQTHRAGYRSIHYVLTTKLHKREVRAEIQVRTIFEEGWSEIDHRVRYPNFSKNHLVASYLTIFNRLSGSADEMGTFVKGLTQELSGLEERVEIANAERESALSKMDRIIKELESKKKQGSELKLELDSLRRELSNLRKVPTLGEVVVGQLSSASIMPAQLDSSGLLAGLSSFPNLSRLPLTGFSTPTTLIRAGQTADQPSSFKIIDNSTKKK